MLQRTSGRVGQSKKMRIILGLLTLMVAVAGCQGPKEDSGSSDQPEQIVIVDDMDREVIVGRVERIVSLAPSATEILFALGLGDRVVGVDNFSNYPAEVETITKVGAYDKPSIETIVSLQPDLVLADSIHELTVRRLEELNIPVAVLFARDLQGILDDILWIGEAAGVTETASELQGELLSRIEAIDKKVSKIPEPERPWVYFEVYSDPIMTCGPNTGTSELIVRAGGRNIAYDSAVDYPEFSPEAILSRNPEVILYPQIHSGDGLQRQELAARPGFSALKAVQEDRIHGLEDDVISRPGPRAVDALEQLYELFYRP